MSWSAVIGYYILALCTLPLAYLSSKGKAIPRKLMIWGLRIATIFNLFLSIAIACTVILLVSSGLGILFGVYLFSFIFVIGVIIFLLGFMLSQKRESKTGLWA